MTADGMRRALIEEIPHLRRFALSLTRDPDRADDLVQACLERALAREALYDPQRALRPWLFQMLRNLFLTSRRRRREDRLDDDRMSELIDPKADRAPDDALALREALAALYALPDEMREVMALICIAEMSYKETAEIIGAPIGTVMSRLARGRETLRRGRDAPQAAQTPRLRRVK